MGTAWSQGCELISIGKCLAARCVPEHLFVHFSCTANNQALAACLSAVMGQDLQQVEDHGVAEANLGLRCASIVIGEATTRLYELGAAPSTGPAFNMINQLYVGV